MHNSVFYNGCKENEKYPLNENVLSEIKLEWQVSLYDVTEQLTETIECFEKSQVALP